MTRTPGADSRSHPAGHSDATGGSASTTSTTGGVTNSRPPETEVRPGETVAGACPHCGRPFTDERARDLHVGEAHDADCTPAERDAHEAAVEAERDDLFYFHLKVVAALGVLYAAIVLVYMAVLGSGLL